MGDLKAHVVLRFVSHLNENNTERDLSRVAAAMENVHSRKPLTRRLEFSLLVSGLQGA